MKKKVIAAILAGTMLLSVIGCGSGDNSSQASDTDETTEATEETAEADETEETAEAEEEEVTVPEGKKGTLEIWTMFTGADGAAFPDIVDAYNATNPDYTVIHRAIAEDELYTKLQLAEASGEGIPDMAMNHIERVAMFQEQGRLLDLTPYLEEAGISKDDYNAKAWEMTDIDGGHYAVPLDVHSEVLWVNMDLYEKYGLTDLDDGVLTWDELEASAETVKADGVTVIGLSWLRNSFLASYGQLGGTLSEDGTNPSFNNDIAVEVLEKYCSLVEKGYTQADGEDSWKAFTGGTVLYESSGVWMYNDVKASGLNIQAFDYPVFDAATKGNWTSSHQMTIRVQPEQDEERVMACLDFMKFVEENASGWAVAGLVPAAKTALEDASFAEMPQYFLASENEELLINGYKYYGYVSDAISNVLNDILFGKISIEDGLSQAEMEVKDMIAME